MPEDNHAHQSSVGAHAKAAGDEVSVRDPEAVEQFLQGLRNLGPDGVAAADRAAPYPEAIDEFLRTTSEAAKESRRRLREYIRADLMNAVQSPLGPK